jgi:hypothetical protein
MLGFDTCGFYLLLVCLLCKYEVFINFYILFSETVMIVFIQWQVGVLNRLSNHPLNSLSRAFAIILITLFWVVNSLFPSVESP